MCLRQNRFSLWLGGSWEDIFPGCLILYYMQVGGEVGEVGLERMDGRRLGGPVDWKTLAPGRESVRGSISSGANVATASLEL